MAGLTNFSTHPEHRAVMDEANSKMKLLSQELFFWVRDGVTFPCLTHVRGLLADSDPTGVNREVAIRDCSSKAAEISRLLENLEFTNMIWRASIHRRPWTKLQVMLINLHRT